MARSSRAALLVACTACTGCMHLAFPTPQVEVTRALPIELAYREGPGGLVLLSGRIDGKSRHDFILDTGAPVTVFVDGPRTASLGFDTSNARPLGDRSESATPVGVITGGHSVELDGVALRGLGVVVIPQRTLPCPERMEAVGFDGVLGADLLRAFVVEIDPKARRVKLHDPKSWRAPGGAASVPLEFRGGHPYLEVPLQTADGTVQRADLHLDTGLNRALTLNAGADAALVYPREGKPTKLCGASAAREARIGRPAMVMMGERAMRDEAPTYFEAGRALSVQRHGSVGIGLFKDRRIAIDYPGKRLVLLE